MNTSQFIDALGGTTAAAAIFEVLPSAVSNWRAAGRFPDRLHLKAYKIAKDQGFEYDPATPDQEAA